MTLVWDWNGTLLDDTVASLAAINEVLSRRNKPTIAFDFYREMFAFPSRNFYRVCGIDLENENWDALAREYHDAYFSHPATLFADTREALATAREAGFRQVVLSSLRQDYLDAAVDRFDLRDFFTHVRGSDNINGATKTQAAQIFARELTSDPRELIFIGDALHDKEVADAVGAACILFGGGSHAPERLARIAPTTNTLLDVVHLAKTKSLV